MLHCYYAPDGLLHRTIWEAVIYICFFLSKQSRPWHTPKPSLYSSASQDADWGEQLVVRTQTQYLKPDNPAAVQGNADISI